MLKTRFGRTTLFSLFLMGVGSVVPATQAQEPGAAEQLTQEQIRKEADQNIKYLSGHALRKAKSILEAHGDFAPFGAALFPGGKVRFVWAVPPGSEQKNINAALVLGAVRKSLQAQAQNGAILGSAVVYLYQPSESKSDKPQINVETEYLNGHAVVTATTYEQDPEGSVTFGAATQRDYDPKVFVAPANTGQ